jgi:uncharacterized protein (UPF0335 family)
MDFKSIEDQVNDSEVVAVTFLKDIHERVERAERD